MKRSFVLTIVFVVFMVAVVFSASLLSTDGGHNQHETGGAPAPGGESRIDLPATVAGLQLVERLDGPQAVQAINGLHGTDVRLSDGAVATYSGGAEKVIIWAGAAQDEGTAGQLIDIMVRKMQDSDAFTVPEPLKYEDLTLYRTTGTGMVHYFYGRGRMTYWFGIQSPREQPIIMELVKRF